LRKFENVIKDSKSRRLALVAHCMLNQNSRALGLAEKPRAVAEIADFLMRKDLGIIQMPCPELAYAGVLRQPQTKEQYDNPTFRGHCRKIADEIAEQIREYEKCGIRLRLILGVDGSPSCAVNREPGILMEELRSVLDKRQVVAPFYGVRFEHLKEDLAKIERMINV